MLTREFLEGRRARYISPLRLYLMASLAYFVLAAATPNIRVRSRTTSAAGVRVSVSMGAEKSGPTSQPTSQPTSRPQRVAHAAGDALEAQQALSPEERAAALEEIARAPAVMRPLLRRAVEDPAGFRRGMLEATPRMLFVLLPAFAAIVALFYRGRRYPEHLYFAIHLHAFIFSALAGVELLKLTRSPGLVEAAGLVALAWVAVYATVAFRNVYGGSVGRTLVKESAIAAIYGLVALAAFAVTIYWVSVAG
jgi:hypothetical protein